MTILVRASPIMETLTGIMIALLIYYSGKLIINDEIGVNNFFSFLAAMMLAYQPVRSLATLNMSIMTGISAAKRILPIIDKKSAVPENETSPEIKISKGNVAFSNVNFKYKINDLWSLFEESNNLDKFKEYYQTLVDKKIYSIKNNFYLELKKYFQIRKTYLKLETNKIQYQNLLDKVNDIYNFVRIYL